MPADRIVDETREGVELTNLDEPLFDDSGTTKRDLVGYLDAMSDRLLPELRGRPLSVVRSHRGREAFMQKNVPAHAPDFVEAVTIHSESSDRDVAYALCDDRATLLWFANQRAVEYHVPMVRASDREHPTHLVLDVDPPFGDGFALAVAGARLVHEVLDSVGLEHVVKTSGSTGLHVYVPVTGADVDDAAAATRAIAARAADLDPDVATVAFRKKDRGERVFLDATRVGFETVAAAWSPRVRPGTPVSFPLRWEDLDDVSPREFTIGTVPDRAGDAGPWLGDLTVEQRIPEALLAEGRHPDR